MLAVCNLALGLTLAQTLVTTTRFPELPVHYPPPDSQTTRKCDHSASLNSPREGRENEAPSSVVPSTFQFRTTSIPPKKCWLTYLGTPTNRVAPPPTHPFPCG